MPVLPRRHGDGQHVSPDRARPQLQPVYPLAEQYRRLAHQHLHGDEEEAPEAEYDDFSDDTSEEGDD